MSDSPLYKIVARYQTADGKVFDDPGTADKHGQDLLAMALEDFLESLGVYEWGSRHTVHKMAVSLVDHRPKNAKLLAELVRLISHTSPEDDDDGREGGEL